MSVSAGSARAVDPHAGPGLAAPRTAVATVCLSGTLEDKLAAAAAAGFDGVEIFEPDFVASPLVGGARSGAAAPTWACRSTSTSPSATSTRPTRERLAANLRRAERKFDVMEALGTDLILVCSVGLPGRRRRRRPHRRAAAHAWPSGPPRAACACRTRRWPGAGTSTPTSGPGRSCAAPTTRRWACASTASTSCPAAATRPASADIPGREAVLPAAGRRPAHGHGRAAVEPPPPAVPRPGRLRPARVPRPRADRRLHRAAVARGVQRRVPPVRPAPGRGRRAALAAGAARGDRATRPGPPAARRRGRRPRACRPTPELRGFAFAELAVDDDVRARGRAHPRRARVRATPAQHRTKPVQLWQQGEARVLLNAAAGGGTHGAAVAALGVETDDPTGGRASGRRRCSRRCCPAPAARPRRTCPRWPRRTGPSVFFCRTGRRATGWLRLPRRPDAGAPGGPDRRSRTSTTSRSPSRSTTSTRRRCSTAALLGLQTQHASEVAAPFGLVRNRTVADAARHAAARAERVRAAPRRVGARAWPTPSTSRSPARTCSPPPARPARPARRCCAIPDNYYDDLDARLAPPPEQLADHARARRAARPRRGTASSCTSTPRCWAGGCSSRSCSGSAATRATARSTPRSGWPRTAGCACDDAGMSRSDGRSEQREGTARTARAGIRRGGRRATPVAGHAPSRRRCPPRPRSARDIPDEALHPRDRGPVRAHVRDVVDAPARPRRPVRPGLRRHPDRRAGPGVEPAALAAADLRGGARRLGRRRRGARPYGRPAAPGPGSRRRVDGRRTGWYAFMRAHRMRILRLPPPRVAPGDPLP